MIITQTLVLTGCRKGFTGVLDKQYRFVDGKIVLRGSEADVKALTLTLERSFAAYPEGSKELEAANGKHDLPQSADTDTEQRVRSKVQSSGPRTAEEAAADSPESDDSEKGEERVRTEGDGHQDSRVSRVWEALTQLDMANDDHWTTIGQPAVAAVASILGEDVTRAEISAAAPNFNRQSTEAVKGE